MLTVVPTWARLEPWPCPTADCGGIILCFDQDGEHWVCGTEERTIDPATATAWVAFRAWQVEQEHERHRQEMEQNYGVRKSPEEKAAEAAAKAARKAAEDARATCVYYLYADDGTLLYVGITAQTPPMLRWREHEKKWWWPLVARHRIDWYGTKSAAKAKESTVIKAVRPVMNKGEVPADQLDANRPTVLRYWTGLGRDPADLPPSRYWEVA